MGRAPDRTWPASTLRLAILGGERLGPRSVQQWRDLGLDGARLLNAYGPTEATITATLGEAGEEEEPDHHRPAAAGPQRLHPRPGRPAGADRGGR